MSWFQSKPRADDSSHSIRGEGPIHLAAFGKHPGWEDHIPGVGLKTEGLVHVKQALYVTAIGGQINAGAWRNLEPEKRIAGFDHWFLWRRAGALFLGRLWSSQDRGGRKEYPMVLCVEAPGVPASSLLSKAWAELEQLRQSCQATDLAVAVTAECGAAQDRLRQAMANGSGPGPLELQIKKNFLDHADLGPDHVGLLRTLHEIETVASSQDPAQSHHWRVPRACPTDGGALLLWFDYLTKALPSTTPLLLIARAASGWVEVIVGEPQTADLFCLQASRATLPLATEIPYEQHWEPETRTRMQNLFVSLEAQFLGDSRAQAVPRAEARPASFQPAPTPTHRPDSGNAQPKRSPLRWFILAGVVLALLGVSAAWLATRDKQGSAPSAAEPPQTVAGTSPFDTLLAEAQQLASRLEYSNALARLAEALTLQPGNETAARLKGEWEAQLDVEQQYGAALKAGLSAFENGQWQAALGKAGEALALKPKDQQASRLQADARAKIDAAAAAAERKRDYDAAMKSANAAMETRDYELVIRDADLALAAMPNDPEAGQLKSAAEQKLQDLSTANETYHSATNAAAAALRAGDYALTIREADRALELRPNDPEAAKLRAEAQRLQAGAVARSRYDQAMAGARAALEAKNFAMALEQAGIALSAKPADPAAQEIKARAEELQRAQLARQQYDEAVAEATAALERNEFVVASQRASEALRLKPGDAATSALKTRAAAGADLQEANRLLAAGNHDAALAVCAAHPADPAFTDLAARIEKTKRAATQNQLAELDLQLQILLVRFNVLPADHEYIQSDEARQTARLSGRLQNVDAYLTQVDRLKAGFESGGWLDQNERERYLEKLRKAIIRAQ